MQEKYKNIIIVVQSLVIVIVLIYILFCDDGNKIAMLEKKTIELQEREAICMQRNDSLAMILQEVRILKALPPFLDESQVNNLKEKGLINPVEDLRDNLIAGPELITQSAVLGGNMGFYFRDGIHILNERWVFAYFEDGHIAGALLLKYSIEDDGRLSWKVLDECIY